MRAISINCLQCVNLLTEPAEWRGKLQDANEFNHRLIINKDKGGLKYPTAFMMNLLLVAENVIRHYTTLNQTNHLTINKLNSEVLSRVGAPPDNLLQHAKDTQNGCTNHYYTIIRKVLERFFKTRQNHINKRKNLALHPNKKRNKLTRLVIFSNQ